MSCNVRLEYGRDDIGLAYGELDGKKIGYATTTEFFVQVGYGKKGGYNTKYKIVGSLVSAVMHYNGINVGNGHKKRLLMGQDVLAVQYSEE